MPRAPRIPEARGPHDVDDEIAFHLESRIAELTALGHAPEAARRKAEAEFGDLRAARHELAILDRHRRRRERLARWLDTVVQYLRHAVRSLRRSPAFTLTAVATLTIGIGASVAIFAVVDGVLLRPLPYGEPERLVAPWHDMPAIGLKHVPQAAATYFTYQRLARTIEGIGIYREAEMNVAEPGGAVEPVRVTSARVTATLLRVLRVSPMLGHALTDEEDRPGAAPVMLIAEGLWRSRFGADPKVIGRTLDVDGVTRTIVGVMPASFRFPVAATQLWVPLQLDPVNPPGAAFTYPGIARLRRGVTVAEAERDFAAVLPRAAEVVPKFVSGITTQQMMEQFHPNPVLVPLRADMTGDIAETLWTVAAAATLVLLVACANVANLTLVRADARQHELAVREALGAGRARVMLQFLAESAVVAAGAAVLSFAAAWVAVRSLVAAGPAGIPRLTEVGVDGTAAAFTLGIAGLVAVLCSLLPTVRFGRGTPGLRDGNRSGTAGRVQHRVRGGLVAAQIALALVVLAGAGLLLRTFQRLHAIRPGFDPEHVSTFWIALPFPRYKSDTAIVQFYSLLIDRVAALPGVTAVGLTSRVPFEVHGNNQNPIYPEDDPTYANRLPPLQLLTTVNADYFLAMRLPIVAGRNFGRMGSQRDGEAIVSRSTARFFWKDSTGIAALGKRFRPLPTDLPYTIVGVANDTRDTMLAAPPSQVVYLPQTVGRAGGTTPARRAMALVVRTAGGTPIDASVRLAVQALDPTLPTFDVRPMTAVMRAATAQLTFIILLLGCAAAVTLILGAVGLYGVLAYVVTLRTREMGIRLALGATPRALATAMTRYGMALTGIGIACGLVLFALVARYLRTLLFGVAASDPVSLGGAALILFAVAMVASWAPARRAARVDPAETLRAQ